MLLMNRLITDYTIEAALHSEIRMQQAASSATTSNALPKVSLVDDDTDLFSSPGKLVQCRICHDDDEDSNMEIPCTCCGSLKVRKNQMRLVLLVFFHCVRLLTSQADSRFFLPI